MKQEKLALLKDHKVQTPEHFNPASDTSSRKEEIRAPYTALKASMMAALVCQNVKDKEVYSIGADCSWFI